MSDLNFQDWRSENTDDVYEIADSDLWEITPLKFRYWHWYLAIGILLAISIVLSALFDVWGNTWWSSMFANVAAGLIASIILMFFTNAKDKTLSFYEIIYIKLDESITKIEDAHNRTYFLERELRRNNKNHIATIDEYWEFAKRYCEVINSMREIYVQSKKTNKISSKHLSLSDDCLSELYKSISSYRHDIELDNSQNDNSHLSDYDSRFTQLDLKALEMLNDLKLYRIDIQEYIWSIKYKRNKRKLNMGKLNKKHLKKMKKNTKGN